MRDLKKTMKHALKTAVLLVTVLVMAAGTVGTTYATDNGTTATLASDKQVFVRRPFFDNDLFFRPRFVDDDLFFRPRIFNPFFDFGFEDDERFDRFDREDD
jgi:hypothetical protein